MQSAQCASLATKPSRVMPFWACNISAIACSTGRPTRSPPIWLDSRSVSTAVALLSFSAMAIALSPALSIWFDSMLTSLTVLFCFNDSPSWCACGARKFESGKSSEVMRVFVAKALQSFGATRGSMCGNGIFKHEKSKISKVGSLIHARWTIQIIQSPRRLAFSGSAGNSAACVTSSTLAANIWSIATASKTFGASAISKVSTISAEPARFVAVAVYSAAGVTAAGLPEMVPVCGFSCKPSGKSGDTLYTEPSPPDSTRGSQNTGAPTV
mmetsp:Transcript_636/g.2128  ORF Transcript_636/g.2128 Transcript_636/m.2128 type:complete len:269 (-) Transcript_636:1536-2342(-)